MASNKDDCISFDELPGVEQNVTDNTTNNKPNSTVVWNSTYPVPKVIDFNTTGFIRISFSAPLLVPIESEIKAFINMIMEDKVLQLAMKETELHQEMLGIPILYENATQESAETRRLEGTGDLLLETNFTW